MKTLISPIEIAQNSHQTSLFERSIQIIRTETVFSRLPIHNLAKTGSVRIEIKRKTASGGTDLLWEVSYNERHGQPRQLAYKIDTLIVNRKIDEGGRPVPKLICLGSLSDICRAFNLAESGTNIKGIKAALLQNASAFITAKLSYKDRGGESRRLEAGFTRYAVIFTGQRLPDGRPADAVYLALTDPYWEVLNHAPVRPLDYEYLKALTPTAQRFYEIVSYRMFAALKHRRPEAKLGYAEYCTYSAQTRHFDYDHFKKQMYKIHQVHLKSGYLSKVRIEQVIDAEGKPDWMMNYAPGVRAHAEYLRSKKKKEFFFGAEDDNAVVKQPQSVKVVSIEEAKQAQESGTDDAEIIDALVARGVLREAAAQLISHLPSDQPVGLQLAWGDYQIQHSPPNKYRNPAGFYVHLLEKNFAVPANFTEFAAAHSSKQRPKTEAATAPEHSKQLRDAYLNYQKRELERFINESMSEKERLELSERVKRNLEEAYPYVAEWPEAQAATALKEATYNALKDRVPVLGFKEFCASNPPIE